jgi:predicted Rossmann fold nucleotide-binding protein DprA/Smf involved in DNA uptake
LLREGAALCANAADVLEALSQRLAEAGMSRFGDLESRILEALKSRSANPDGLASLLKADPGLVARALGRLEVGGVVVRDLGGYRRA